MRWRRRLEDDLELDIRSHIELEIEDNLARGMSPADARNAALRKFGNIALVKEDTRAQWRGAALDTWLADLRHSFRRIRRSPGPPALAVLSLALAFAPSVTIFSLMDSLFLADSGIRAPDQIQALILRDTRRDASRPFQSASYPEYQDLRASARSFSGLTYQSGKLVIAALRNGRSFLGTHIVNEDYFSVLGVPLRIGPGFRRDHAGVVISQGLWMREFDGRPDAIGRTILINGESFTVDGVAPADFRGIERVFAVDLWIPIETWMRSTVGQREHREARDHRDGNLWGRLRPGASPATASAEVESFYRGLADRHPATNRHLVAYSYPVVADRQRGGASVTAMVAALFGILLAVACANVTGILLARAEERRHETAVRQTLGASRGRLMREWMVESAVLSLLAAALGLACARFLMDRLPGMLPTMLFPIRLEFSFSSRVWIYAASLVFLSTLAFGLVPAWRASRPDLLSGLRRDSAIDLFRVRIPIRSILIVLQVAAAEFLLFSAGVVLATVSAVDRLGAGFDPRRPVAVATVVAAAEDAGFRPLDSEAIRDRLARIPGVRRVAWGRRVPLAGSIGGNIRLDLPGQESRTVNGGAVGPGFLSMLGVRFLAGRDLEPADSAAIVVNATLARQLDPVGNVVGRDVRLDGVIRHIVGVFDDVKWNSIYDQPRPYILSLVPARMGGEAMFAVEVDGKPDAWVATLRAELAAAQPGISVIAPKTLWQYYKDALFVERSVTRVFYAMGAIALLLTITGLHGIARALYTRRSREFAIRLALGAPPRRLAGAILAHGLKLSLIGLALGIAVAVPLAMFVGSRVFGLSPWSFSAFGLSSAAVIAAAVFAAAQPAARVLRITPGDVVRSE